MFNAEISECWALICKYIVNHVTIFFWRQLFIIGCLFDFVNSKNAIPLCSKAVNLGEVIKKEKENNKKKSMVSQVKNAFENKLYFWHTLKMVK